MRFRSVISDLPVAPAAPAVTGHRLPDPPETPPLTIRRPSSREMILDAAEAVVLAEGAAHLTLDAVAERAGVSKGGLLYHFHTKELLLQAMVDRHMHRIEEARVSALDRLPPGVGRELKACVLMAGDRRMDNERRLGSATLAATANNPRLLEPVRDAQRRRLQWCHGGDSSGLPFDRAAVITLAVDGLCLLEVLQISPYDDAQRRRILDDLLRLVDETAVHADPPHGESAPSPDPVTFSHCHGHHPPTH